MRQLFLILINIISVSYAAEGSRTLLFELHRSTNKNYLRYELCHTLTGEYCSDPIQAHWVMLEDGGRREELGVFEANEAYGVKVYRPIKKRFLFSLNALKKRKIFIDKDGKAIFIDDKKQIIITKIYVKVKEAFLVPKVLYIDIIGLNALTKKEDQVRVIK